MLKVASEWFSICGGCEVTILDIGAGIIDLLSKIDIVNWPILYDHKYFGSTGEGTEMIIPKADVGIITGGIRTEKERELAKIMRDSVDTLIADGACAVNGGVPALANMFTNDEIADYVRSTPSKDHYDTLPMLSSTAFIFLAA